MTESPEVATREAERPIDVQHYFSLLRKNLVLIIAVWLAVLVAGAIYVSSLPRIYSATSSVLLQQPVRARVLPGYSDFSSPGQPSNQLGTSAFGGPSLETAARLVTTRMRAEKTVARINKKVSRRDLRVTADDVVGSLTARIIPPDQIQIEARSTIPEKSMLIANVTADVFKAETKSDASQNATTARQFLDETLIAVRADLDKSEDKLAALRKEQMTFDLPAEAKMQGESLAKLETDSRVQDADVQMTRRRIDSVRSRITRESATEKVKGIAQDPIVKNLREQLLTAEVEEMKARSKYTEDHPQVMIAKRQAVQIRDRLSKEASRTIETEEYVANPLYRAAREQLMQEELKLIELESRRAATERLIGEARAKMRLLPDRQRQFQRLLRQVEVASRVHNMILDKIQDARLNERVQKDEQGSARIADYAGLPAAPVLPKVSQTLVFSGLLGLFAGVMAAFLRESLDTSLHTPEDVTRHVGIACLGFVPRLQTSTNGATGIITLNDPRSPAAEAYRTLRSNLKYASLDNPAKCLLITSAVAGEGKSITVANLGVTLADAGNRVLIIDSDLRRPSQHLYFDVDNEIGFTSILVRDVSVDRAVKQTQVASLSLLTSGPIPPNPAELLDSGRAAEFIKSVREEYDFVLMDSPPALIVTDAMVLAGLCDATILVCEAEKVHRTAAHRVMQLIEHARGRMLGAVLNKIRFTRGGYYYYPYYYYYYGKRK